MASAGAEALAVRNLSVVRGRKRAPQAVLRQVSLACRFGEVFAILGPNGAGKSTLLKACMGLLPFRGTIEVGGRSLAELPLRQRVRSLAYVPQTSQLTSALPVETVISHGRYATGGLARPSAQDRRRVQEAMAQVDVVHLAHRPFTQLSGGEQRRVLLARALATGSRTILLDEPTSSLDIGHVLGLHQLLSHLARDGFCVVLVLHQLHEAASFTHRAALLREGRLMGLGPTNRLLTAQMVRDVYGVELVRKEGLSFELAREVRR